jgi:hypothetical protein
MSGFIAEAQQIGADGRAIIAAAVPCVAWRASLCVLSQS